MRSQSFFLLFLLTIISSTKPYFRPYLFAELPKPKECFYLEGKIKIDAQYLSAYGCKKFFGLDLVKKGYRPLLVTVTNLSQVSYILRQENIKLDTVDSKYLVSSLYSSQKPSALLVASRCITMGQISLVGASALAAAALYNSLFVDALSYYALDSCADYRLVPGFQMTFFVFVHEKLCKNRFEFFYVNASLNRLECVDIDLLKNIDSRTFLKPSCLILN